MQFWPFTPSSTRRLPPRDRVERHWSPARQPAVCIAWFFLVVEGFFATPSLTAEVGWTGRCGDGNWHSCCYYGSVDVRANNWSFDPVASPACPPFPGPDDEVDFGGTNVTLQDANASVKALEGTGVFTLGGGSFGKLTVSEQALFGGLLVFRDSGTFAGGLGKANAGAQLQAAISQGVSAGILEVSGMTTWPGTGSLVLSGGGTFRNLPGALFTGRNGGSINSGAGGGVFQNQGDFSKQAGSGTLRVRSGVTFNNSGGVNIPSGKLSLEGTGTSAGTFMVQDLATLAFAGGYHTLAPGSTVMGAGNVEFSAGTASVQGLWSVAGLTTISLGTVLWDSTGSVPIEDVLQTGGVFGGTGHAYIQGDMVWRGGSMAGGGTTDITADGRLQLRGPATKSLYGGRVLNNYSAASSWADTGNLNIYSGATLTNRAGALFEILGDAEAGYPSGQTAGTLRNVGTLRKSGGAGATRLLVVLDNDGGVLDILSGRLEVLGDAVFKGTGTALLADGAELVCESTCEVSGWLDVSGLGTMRIVGPADVGGEIRVADDASVTVNLPKGGLIIDGGSVGWDGYVQTSGKAEWLEGVISGPGGLRNSGLLSISGPGSKLLFGRLETSGPCIQSNADVVVGNMAGFTPVIFVKPGGRYDLQGDVGVSVALGADDGIVTNGGVFSKAAGTGVSNIRCRFESHDALTEALTGTLRLSGGGASTAGEWKASANAAIELADEAFTFIGASSGEGAGGLRLASGSLSVPGGSTATFNYSAGGFEIAGGVLDGAGVVNVSGIGNWTGGDIEITGGVNSSGQFTINSPAAKALRGGVIRNSGTVAHSGSPVAMSQGAIITNLGAGLYDLAGGAGLTGDQAEFINQGTFQKHAGGGVATVSALFTNTGLVRTESGALALAGGGTSVSGAFEWESNSILRFEGGVFTFSGLHSASGSGTAEITGSEVRISSGAEFGAPGGLYVLLNGMLSGKGSVLSDVHNAAGEVSPGGDAVGHLSILGDYAQGSGGVLTVRIAGIQASSYDRLVVSGEASLAGTLQVDLGGYFAPSVGDQFVILTCDSRVGQFQNVRGSGPFGVTFAFSVAYSSNAVTLQVTGVTPPVLPLADAKALPDGWPVQVNNLVVTAVLTDCVYVQRQDRACGVRVQYSGDPLDRGDVVMVSGRTGVSIDGEKLILADTVSPSGSFPVVALTMTCGRVGGAASGYDPVSGAGQAAVGSCPYGLNNVGLFVRISGKVTSVGSGGDTFTIDDGSTCGSGGASVEVSAPGIAAPSLGQMVSASGASSCRQGGNGLSAVIRVAAPADVTVQ